MFRPPGGPIRIQFLTRFEIPDELDEREFVEGIVELIHRATGDDSIEWSAAHAPAGKRRAGWKPRGGDAA